MKGMGAAKMNKKKGTMKPMGGMKMPKMPKMEKIMFKTPAHKMEAM